MIDAVREVVLKHVVKHVALPLSNKMVCIRWKLEYLVRVQRYSLDHSVSIFRFNVDSSSLFFLSYEVAFTTEFHQ